MAGGIDEAAVITRIRDAFEAQLTSGARGLRDDCTIVSPPSDGAQLVMSCDQMWRGRHFAPYEPGEVVGARAVVRAASDIGAAGGIPRDLMWTFVLDEDALEHRDDGSFFERFLNGAAEVCRNNDIRLSGGDVTAGEKFGASLIVTGTVRGTPLTRSGATAGANIFLSAPTGAAARDRRICDVADAFVAEAHRGFSPTLSPLAAQLCGVAQAATDVSDGLVQDLAELVAPVGLGATLFGEVVQTFGPSRTDVLYGGDDYVLLWTQIEARPPLPGSICIGRVEGEGEGIAISGPSGREPLTVRGYDPFV